MAGSSTSGSGWAQIASAGSGLLGSIFGGAFNMATTRRNYKRQKKLMALEQDYNLQNMEQQNLYNIDMLNRENAFTEKMWNAENEYNSAENQVNRLRAAGLNPALAMGNAGMSDSVSSGSGSGAGLPSAPQANSAINMPFMEMNDLFDGALKLATIRKIDSETNKNNQDTNTSAANENMIKAQTEYQKTLNKWADLSEEQRIENTRAAIRLALSGSEKNQAEKDQVVEQTSWIGRLNQAQLDKLTEDTNLAFEQALTEENKRRNFDASSKAALSQVTLNRLLGDKAAEDAALANITSEKVRKEIDIAANDAVTAYYRSEQERLKAGNYADGVDSNASMAGAAMLFLHRTAQEANKAIDSAKDVLQGAKEGIRRAARSRKFRSPRGSSTSDVMFNPSMQD